MRNLQFQEEITEVMNAEKIELTKFSCEWQERNDGSQKLIRTQQYRKIIFGS